MFGSKPQAVLMNTGLPLGGAGVNIPNTRVALVAQKARNTIPIRAEEIEIIRKLRRVLSSLGKLRSTRIFFFLFLLAIFHPPSHISISLLINQTNPE